MAAVKPSFSAEATGHEDSLSDHTPVASVHSVHTREVRCVESVRLGLSVLTLLTGLVIIGTTGDALAVFNRTNVYASLLLPLWPSVFDVSPTIALLTGGCVVVVVNIISVAGSKTAFIRNHTLIHPGISLLTPVVSLIASIIAIAFYYSINASSTTENMQSWSCTWASISMTAEPHFNKICRECRTSLILSIILIPFQVIVVALAAITFVQEKKQRVFRGVEEVQERKGSPAMS